MENMQIPIDLSITLPTNTSFKPLETPQQTLLFKNGAWHNKPCTYNYYGNTVFGLQPILNITMSDFCS